MLSVVCETVFVFVCCVFDKVYCTVVLLCAFVDKHTTPDTTLSYNIPIFFHLHPYKSPNFPTPIYLNTFTQTQATGVYIPVSPLLLEMLQWSELRKTPTGTAAAPDLLLLLRLSKTQLKTAATQEEVVSQVCVWFVGGWLGV